MNEWAGLTIAALVGVPAWAAWWHSRAASRKAEHTSRLAELISSQVGTATQPLAAAVTSLRAAFDAHAKIADRERRRLETRVRHLEESLR